MIAKYTRTDPQMAEITFFVLTPLGIYPDGPSLSQALTKSKLLDVSFPRHQFAESGQISGNSLDGWRSPHRPFEAKHVQPEGFASASYIESYEF